MLKFTNEGRKDNSTRSYKMSLFLENININENTSGITREADDSALIWINDIKEMREVGKYQSQVEILVESLSNVLLTSHYSKTWKA